MRARLSSIFAIWTPSRGGFANPAERGCASGGNCSYDLQRCWRDLFYQCRRDRQPLCRAFVAANIEPQIIIVASSAQIYAAPNSDAPLTEDCPLAPETHYAVSKRTAEDIARIYSGRFPVIVTRPFNYTGPGQSSSVSRSQDCSALCRRQRRNSTWATWICFGIFPISDVLWPLIRSLCQVRLIQPPSTSARGGPFISAIFRKSWRTFPATA